MKRIMQICFLAALLMSIGFWPSLAHAFPNEPVGFAGLRWGTGVANGMKLVNEDPVTFDQTYVRPTDVLSFSGAALDTVHYTYNLLGEFFQVTIKGKESLNYDKLLQYLKKTHGPAEDSRIRGRTIYHTWSGDTAAIELSLDNASSPVAFSLSYTGVKIAEFLDEMLKGAADAMEGSKKGGGKKEDPYKGLFD